MPKNAANVKITLACSMLYKCLDVTGCVQGMPKRVTNVKIACLDMNLQKARMMMGVQVLVNDPSELEKVRL